MKQYIDKSALVAEIERLKDNVPYFPTIAEEEAYKEGVDSACCKVSSLEVKEVDLEKEIDRVWDNTSDNFSENGWKEFENIAKHFFKLGLKAQKDNIWHTVDETPNYPCDILFLTNVDNMFLYRYMENGRPVDRETPYFNTILNGKCWCYCNDIVNK